jgi:Na+/citrate or Na+/malate symporter
VAALSRKINSPRLAAALGLVLIILGINGLIQADMPTIVAILIIIVGVINMLRLLPQEDEASADAKQARDAKPAPDPGPA